MSIGLAAGFSGITNPTDLERQREYEHSGNSKLLFYFSPELAFAFRDLSNVEIVFRLHHRSGLYGTLGRMREGSNTHAVEVALALLMRGRREAEVCEPPPSENCFPPFQIVSLNRYNAAPVRNAWGSRPSFGSGGHSGVSPRL
jgi:hypothetical protein